VDIGQRPKLHNTNEDYGGILVNIRTDLQTCFLGVYIAKRESGSGGRMTRDRQGELTTKGVQGRIRRSERPKGLLKYTKDTRRPGSRNRTNGSGSSLGNGS
jgi:hypothetical protein